MPNVVASGQTNAEIIFRFFKMAAATILDLEIFIILTVGTLKRSTLRYRAKFLGDRSNFREHMPIFPFFQYGSFPPSWICDARVWTVDTHEWHLVVFITVQNLVGIDAVVSITCTFFYFTSVA